MKIEIINGDGNKESKILPTGSLLSTLSHISVSYKRQLLSFELAHIIS